jgi:crossover junction endodeoxyribonuclease RuvC
VGLDLSLRSTGISDGTQEGTHAFQTDDSQPIEWRMHRIRRACMEAAAPVSLMTGCSRVRPPNADLVVIEGSAYGAKGNAVEQLAALRYEVRVALWSLRIPFAIVPPTRLKAYTTGDGKASKAKMVNAVIDAYGLPLKLWTVAQGRYDMADAFALAAMGYKHLGHPLKAVGNTPEGEPGLTVTDWKEERR